MPNFDWTALVGQLGASAIFAAALVIVVKAFYDHLIEDQKVMRERISFLEAKIDQMEKAIHAIR